MRRILVVSTAGVDEPWLAEPVAQLAADTGAAVTVLAVDDVESQRFEPLPREEHLRRARETADRNAERLRAAGVEAVAVVRSGPAATAAIDYADEIDADLIVVGSRRRRGVIRRLIGSLPFQLVQRSGRQVFVVSEPG